MLYFNTKIHHQGAHIKSYYDSQTNGMLKKQKKNGIWCAPWLVTCIHSKWDIRSLLLHNNVTSHILKIFIIIKKHTFHYSKTCLKVLLTEVDGFAQAHK